MRLPAFFAVLLVAASAGAHDFAFTDVRLEVRAGGTWVADVGCDVDALALGVPSTADSAALTAEIEALSPAARDALVAHLASLLERRIRVRFDGEPVPFEVSLPERGQARRPGEPPTALGLVVRLTGRVPEGAHEVTFFASRAFPPVRLVLVRPGETPWPAEVVPPGAESRPVALAGERAPAHAGETFIRFAALGVTHILPYGLDHVLFVVGLALLSPRLGPLLAQGEADHRELTDLHADVEGEEGRQAVAIGEPHPGEDPGEPEAVQEAETEDQHEPRRSEPW
jgi:hypothetical protein